MSEKLRIQPVIMSGGSGTRLWPMSRKARPKQFLPLVTEETLFQETVKRLQDDSGTFAPPLVISGALHIDHINTQLKALGIAPAAIIIEPCPRNTAAVAAVAQRLDGRKQPWRQILLTPADHHIANAEKFRSDVVKGANAAASGAIVTFGIKPTEAHTGFGYIEEGAPLSEGVYKVSAFREKPDQPTAESYLQKGGYHWNAGIFLFAAEAMLSELSAFAPMIKDCCETALSRAKKDGVVLHLDEEAFSQSPSDSIDYAVMEKTDKAAVVAPVDVGWNDIGSWTAIPPQEEGPQVKMIGCQDTTILTDGPLVAAIGVDDLVIVATEDAVLVAPKSRAQDVKKIVEKLKSEGRDALL